LPIFQGDILPALMVKMASLKNANFFEQNKLKIQLPYAFENLKILYLHGRSHGLYIF
jgi:hypothetical protein